MSTILLASVLLLPSPSPGARSAPRNHAFAVETGRPFDAALPHDFYLEGNAIPTEKRNAALLVTPSGKQLLFALLDTSGYSSEVQQKYIGMIIAEGPVMIGGARIPVGSYGFGLKKAGGKTFLAIYNQAGTRMGSCLMKMDSRLQAPRQLQVILAGAAARLYIGRDWVEVR